MPFKIIETIEKGQKRLCIVPSSWESKGELRWPRKRLDVNKLVKDENFKPLDNWSTSKCFVKRLSLSSYEEAIRELNSMVQNSDTETDYVDNVTDRTNTPDNNNIIYNALASQLVLNQLENSTVTKSTPALPEATTAAQYVIQYVDDSELATVSVDTHLSEFETQTPIQSQKDVDMNQIETYLKIILDNQYNMARTMNVLEENQKKFFHKLANLSVQIEHGFSKCDQNKNTDVVSLGDSNSFKSESFIIKPIDSIKELEEMEIFLSDKKQKFKLLKQYSFVCSQSYGKGGTCAYKILDMFFSREFLCKCSWTGGSRNSDEVKVGLKGYKKILNFYYELIRSWDKTYTAEDNENFFKIVLKNSVKRKLSKNERASTKRKRTKKGAIRNSNIARNESDQANQDKNENIIDKDVTNEIEIIDEDEDESLC